MSGTPENLESEPFSPEKFGFRRPPDSGKSGVKIYKRGPLGGRSRRTWWEDSNGTTRVEVLGVCGLHARGGVFAGLVFELEKLERRRDTARRYRRPFPEEGRLQELCRKVGPDRRPCAGADLCWHGLRWEITVYGGGLVFAVAPDHEAALLEARRLMQLDGLEEEWP